MSNNTRINFFRCHIVETKQYLRIALSRVFISFEAFHIFFFFSKKKQDEDKSELNKRVFSKHKPMYVYLRLVSGRGRRTHHPHDSALNALPLSSDTY